MVHKASVQMFRNYRFVMCKVTGLWLVVADLSSHLPEFLPQSKHMLARLLDYATLAVGVMPTATGIGFTPPATLYQR